MGDNVFRIRVMKRNDVIVAMNSEWNTKRESFVHKKKLFDRLLMKIEETELKKDDSDDGDDNQTEEGQGKIGKS